MENQFELRKGLSTDMAVLKLVDWTNDAFEAGLIPAAVLLDMRKAFDTVEHSGFFSSSCLNLGEGFKP